MDVFAASPTKADDTFSFAVTLRKEGRTPFRPTRAGAQALRTLFPAT